MSPQVPPAIHSPAWTADRLRTAIEKAHAAAVEYGASTGCASGQESAYELGCLTAAIEGIAGDLEIWCRS